MRGPARGITGGLHAPQRASQASAGRDQGVPVSRPGPERNRRRELAFNILQAVCILVFVLCIAIDPTLHAGASSTVPERKNQAGG